MLCCIWRFRKVWMLAVNLHWLYIHVWLTCYHLVLIKFLQVVPAGTAICTLWVMEPPPLPWATGSSTTGSAAGHVTLSSASSRGANGAILVKASPSPLPMHARLDQRAAGAILLVSTSICLTPCFRHSLNQSVASSLSSTRGNHQQKLKILKLEEDALKFSHQIPLRNENAELYWCSIILVPLRVSCNRQGGIRFTLHGNAWFNYVLVHNVAGDGDVAGVSIKGDNGGWTTMYQNWGQFWSASEHLVGQALSFRVTLGSGRTQEFYDVASPNWYFGQTYEADNNQNF